MQNFYKHQLLRNFILIVTILFSSIKVITANENTEPIQILFIGHSYFIYNDLPSLVENLAINSNKEVYIDSYLVPGTSLYEHAYSEVVETKVYERDWDYIILIGSGASMAYPDLFYTSYEYSALLKFRNIISDNYSKTKMILCMCWANEDGFTFSEGISDSYAQMQESIYENTIFFSNNIGFTTAPVGWAWYSVLEEKEYPLHYLHTEDWSHPALKGSYLMACVIYSTLYQETSEDIPYYADLTIEEANYFQRIGSKTVIDNLELWNISGFPTATVDVSSRNESLYQNTPNPFRISTQIKFDISFTSNVEIKVYDLLGRIHTTLINEEKEPGSYSINFNANELPSGMYLYSLKTTKGIEVKKMQIIK